MTSFSTRPYSNHLRGLVSLIVTPIVLHLLAVWSKYGLDKKPPKKLSGLPVLHFAGGLMDCFQKKNIDILHTLCALSLLSRIYVDCDCGQTNSKVEYLDENFEKFGRKLQVLKCFESTRMIKRKDKQKSLHKT